MERHLAGFGYEDAAAELTGLPVRFLGASHLEVAALWHRRITLEPVSADLAEMFGCQRTLFSCLRVFQLPASVSVACELFCHQARHQRPVQPLAVFHDGSDHPPRRFLVS